MAIAEYTSVRFTPQTPGEGIRTAFDRLPEGATYPLRFLSRLKTSLDERFEQFSRGELDVHKILTRPDDLAIYTLASLLQDTDGDLAGIGAVGALPHPGRLSSRSDLPMGAGFGSSAAVVAAVTVLFETLLNRPKTIEDRYDRVRFCERLKHGKSGPIDAATVVRGGLVQVDDTGVTVPCVSDASGLRQGEGWFWVLHGRPVSSTGECVAHVRAHYAQDHQLWQAFGDCTKALAGALSDGTDPRPAIAENQTLLTRIGVVPERTQAFVAAVESRGGAAKICGAGSVSGPHGGALLVRLDPDEMADVMSSHPGVSWSPLRMSPTGAAAGPAPARKGCV